MRKTQKKFKKWSLFFALLLLSTVVLTPLTLSQTINDSNTIKPLSTAEDFCITIHRIQQNDEIDPWPHGEADWQLRMYVNDVKITFEVDGDDVIVDEVFTWEDAIPEGMKFVDIKMELLDLDPWPDISDIADISACIDSDYQEGDYDNTVDFGSHRPAVFMRTYNLFTESWEPEDEDNDYLDVDNSQPPLIWFITGGNYDGSTTVDENDATVWFSISVGNTPPYPPEKPTGATIGWIGEVLLFSTKSYDDDGDLIQFGWDWDGDSVVDELTGFYQSWEEATILHSWNSARIYYIKVIAIEENGLTSGWSDPLKVSINGPEGKSGFEEEPWTLGTVYSTYMDHWETQELISILRSGGNIVTAAATLIVAVAAACGVPLDINIAIAIVTAILRIGVEILNLMDRGMGIYFRAYIIEVAGWPIGGFAYVWSQTLGTNAWDPPEGNVVPNVPPKPVGKKTGVTGMEYTYSVSNIDPDGDDMTYIFEWGDGTYNCTDLVASGDTASYSHIWETGGSYNIRVKCLDIYGQESDWSDPLSITMPRTRSMMRFSLFFDILEKFKEQFPILGRLQLLLS